VPEDKADKDSGTDVAATAEKPTLKTISRLSGLAVPTVSRALNDAPDIGAETKKLVRRIADEIGYVPNRAGVRLRTGRTNVISLVMSTEHDMMNHTARLISSLASGLRGTPYHMIVTPYAPGDDIMKPVRYIVESGSADAIVFNQTAPEDVRAEYLLERNFPFVTHGRTNFSAQHGYFDFDNLAFGRIGIRALTERGRRKVLMIAPPRSQNYGREMIEGASEAATLFGMELIVSDRITSDSPGQDVRTAMVDHLQEEGGIDAVLAGSTNAAMASTAAFESVGLAVGRDFDLFSKEAIRFLKFFRPEILAVREDVGKAGAFLAQAAIHAIRHPDEPPMQGLEVPQWPQDQST
jgi:LacI family transcriptional regulator